MTPVPQPRRSEAFRAVGDRGRASRMVDHGRHRRQLTDRAAPWRDVVVAVARLICECDGRRWEALAPWEQDRYARVAALVEDTIARMRGGSSRAEAIN